MRIEPLEEWHLEQMALQPAQRHVAPSLANAEYRRALCEHEGFAGVNGDQVDGAAGLVVQWEDRALAWALFSDMTPTELLMTNRTVQAWFAECEIRRIEAWVDAGFAQGKRWMRMLGCRKEGKMLRFRPDGTNVWLYARVKDRGVADG